MENQAGKDRLLTTRDVGNLPNIKLFFLENGRDTKKKIYEKQFPMF